jgi:ribose transport system ATP-binding protein
VTAQAAVVELAAIRKAFGSNEVLRGIDLAVAAGEVHALVGENGAGKSTLIRILSGVEAADAGALRLHGAVVRFRSPIEARRAGIATIHQELSLVGSMSIADNLFLGDLGRRPFAFVDRRRERDEALRVLGAFGLDCDPDAPVSELPIAAQQLVEIAKALRGDAKLLVLDEPTSALGDEETRLLLREIARLRDGGAGVLFVTHRLDEIDRIADRVTVLRDGVIALTTRAAELPRARLVQAMIGDAWTSPPAARPPARRAEAPPRLAIAGFSVRSTRAGRLDVRGVDLSIAAGEIVGIAGVRGSGGTELLLGLFGERSASGRLEIDGAPASLESPAGAIRAGVAFLPNDRKSSFLLPALDALANTTLASLSRFRVGPFLSRAKERAAAERVRGALGLERVALDAPAGALSGGTQQKLCLARCVLAGARVLLLDEPTRGVDVGAKVTIHEGVRAVAARGLAVLFVSSDAEELFALAHRIVVLSRGAVALDVARDAATREAVVRAATGAAPTGATA